MENESRSDSEAGEVPAQRRVASVPFAVVADYAVRTSDGKISIVGTFDEVNPTLWPASIPHMYFAFRVEIPPGQWHRPPKLRIHFTDPVGTVLTEFEGEPEVNPPKHPDRPMMMNQVVGLGNPEFHDPGQYAWRIYLDDVLASFTPVWVNPLEEEPRADG